MTPVGSKMASGSGSPISAPVASASMSSIRTSPGALGQRPSTSRVSHASSRDQKVVTPRRALKRGEVAMRSGSCHGPCDKESAAARALRSAPSRVDPWSGVKTRLVPVRPGGVSCSRVTT